jgi:hypothetical protein
MLDRSARHFTGHRRSSSTRIWVQSPRDAAQRCGSAFRLSTSHRSAQKRRASLGCFSVEKIAPGCPRTRPWLLVGFWMPSFCPRLLAAVLAAYRVAASSLSHHFSARGAPLREPSGQRPWQSVTKVASSGEDHHSETTTRQPPPPLDSRERIPGGDRLKRSASQINTSPT